MVYFLLMETLVLNRLLDNKKIDTLHYSVNSKTSQIQVFTGGIWFYEMTPYFYMQTNDCVQK